ncbi:MAG: hypothetical protein NC818_00235 [Candidatus Omnitrophica bacterium]|nr:hypothetical protein [Candidatus Omnitrophota bacterium]
MRYLIIRKIVIILFFLALSQTIVFSPVYARRVKWFGGELSLLQENNFFVGLEDSLKEFVIKFEDARVIKSISQPEPLEGDAPFDSGEKIVTYKIEVLTDKGVSSLVVKLVSSREAKNFLTASLRGVSPGPAIFVEQGWENRNGVSEGYLIYRFFEGVKLSEICNQEQAIDILKNNLWIIEELGIKLANLKKAGVKYRDFLYYNTLIDLEKRALVIVDYGDRHCADPFIQVRDWWLPLMFNTEPEILEKVISLFVEVYQRELNN